MLPPLHAVFGLYSLSIQDGGCTEQIVDVNLFKHFYRHHSRYNKMQRHV